VGDRKCEFDGCDAQQMRTSGYCLRHKVEQLIKIPRRWADDVILQEAIEALGDIGYERAVEPLIEILRMEDNDVILQEAIEALGDIGDERAVEPLIEFINGELMKYKRERGYGLESAVYALGKIGGDHASGGWLGCLDDEDGGVRYAAVSVMVAAAESPMPDDLVDLLKGIMMNDDDSSVALRAAQALAGDERAKEALRIFWSIED